MLKNTLLPLLLLAIISLGSCHRISRLVHPVNENIHTFYYAWYGNPETDGEYAHWNHGIIPHHIDTTWNDAGSYPGGKDIGANFYPELGSYSSNDPALIKKHMKQIRNAGIGVLAYSWWGEGSFTERSLPLYLDLAHKYGLKLAFHIEPIYKSPEEFKKRIRYLKENYASHPAFYKIGDQPFYYIYDSYKMNYRKWNSILNPESENSLRNTDLDGIYISLWTLRLDGEFALVSGFDGVYTYYGSDGYAHGSTTENWKTMAEYAREHEMMFIPCVGPGYIDTRIRPWNERTTRNREDGKYYERMFGRAVETRPDIIGITSFNEWHEGTQIEPAIPLSLPHYRYEDYGEGRDPGFYLEMTRKLIRSFEQEMAARE